MTGAALAAAGAYGGHGLYGPPPSTADQKKLGVVTDMPGVHIQCSMHALHGGEAREWVSKMAASTSMAGLSGQLENYEDVFCPLSP